MALNDGRIWEGRPTRLGSGDWGVSISDHGGLPPCHGDIVKVTARNGRTWFAAVGFGENRGVFSTLRLTAKMQQELCERG